jgi:hypothetical protein
VFPLVSFLTCGVVRLWCIPQTLTSSRPTRTPSAAHHLIRQESFARLTTEVINRTSDPRQESKINCVFRCSMRLAHDRRRPPGFSSSRGLVVQSHDWQVGWRRRRIIAVDAIHVEVEERDVAELLLASGRDGRNFSCKKVCRRSYIDLLF